MLDFIRAEGSKNEEIWFNCSRTREPSRNARCVDPKALSDVSFYIVLQLSPEQFAGMVTVSDKCVDFHFYVNKAARGDLHKNMRSQKPRLKCQLSIRDRRRHIPNRRPFSKGLSHVEERNIVIGAAHKQAIVTLVERKSGFSLLAKVPNKCADLLGWAIEAKLKPLNLRVKTLTVGNGKEFADHQPIDQALGIQTFFTDLYCSWHRGSNHNFHGLLSQYIPKKRRMETVTDEELTMIENRLNHRPKKWLGFKIPHQVFHASLNRVALRA